MELNTAERFPLLDADEANHFHSLIFRASLQARQKELQFWNNHLQKIIIISEGFFLLRNQSKIITGKVYWGITVHEALF